MPSSSRRRGGGRRGLLVLGEGQLVLKAQGGRLLDSMRGRVLWVLPAVSGVVIRREHMALPPLAAQVGGSRPAISPFSNKQLKPLPSAGCTMLQNASSPALKTRMTTL